MKKRGWGAVLVLTALCAACGGRQSAGTPGEGQAEVWFLTAGQEEGSETIWGEEPVSALDREVRDLPEGRGDVETLMGLLLSGPEGDGLRSPFPQGTRLNHWSVEGDLAALDLSEAYGGLSGVELSLADACVTLTLCQLPQVERVYLTVEGQQRPYRDQILCTEDFLLAVGEG